MIELILWPVTFLVIYLFYEIFVIRKEKTLQNMKDGKELSLLSKRYHLNYQKINLKQLVRVVAIANAFIISTVVMVVSLLNIWITNFLLWMLSVLVIGLLLLIPLVLLIYSQIGKYYQNIQKGGK